MLIQVICKENSHQDGTWRELEWLKLREENSRDPAEMQTHFYAKVLRTTRIKLDTHY